MSYKIMRATPIAKPLKNSDKSIQTSQYLIHPKYYLAFLNTLNGRTHVTTDYDIKQGKKKKCFDMFKNKYLPLFKRKEISLSLFVTDKEDWPEQPKFISYIKQKIVRMGVSVLGFVWANDLGEEQGKRHTHTVVATTRLTPDQSKALIHKKHKYKVVLCNNVKAFTRYLKKKELYAEHKKRSWGRSNDFKSPTKLKSQKAKPEKPSIPVASQK